MEANFMFDIMKDKNAAGRLTIADWEELSEIEKELYEKMKQYETAIDDKYGDSMILNKVKNLQQQMTDVFGFLSKLHMSVKDYKGDMTHETN